MRAFGILLIAASVSLIGLGIVPVLVGFALAVVGVVIYIVGFNAFLERVRSRNATAASSEDDERNDALRRDLIDEEDALHGFYNQHSWKYDSND